MFPFFELSSNFIIYTFWLTITICFFLFLWMLKKLSKKFGYDYSIFTWNILWYFLSTFIFSRLFYVIWRWNDLKYIKDPFEFFIMNNYNFSLVWAIIGFFLILLINIKSRKESLEKYIDAVSISFLFILFIWFIWAFLGWQVYGKETHFGIEILYTHPFTPVPFEVPIFPLPIVYSIIFFILFSIIYILSIFVHIKSLLWYLGFVAFASIMLIFESFSWKYDILKNNIWINITQFFSIFIIIFCIYKLFIIFKNNNKERVLLSNKE